MPFRWSPTRLMSQVLLTVAMSLVSSMTLMVEFDKLLLRCKPRCRRRPGAERAEVLTLPVAETEDLCR